MCRQGQGITITERRDRSEPLIWGGKRASKPYDESDNWKETEAASYT